MRTTSVLLAALALLIVPGFALEGAALSRACISPPGTANGQATFAVVTGTLGLVLPTACPGNAGPYHISLAPACPATVGPQPGEYCGPVIPPLSKAVCTWLPVVNTVPTGLYAGFDRDGDGHVFITSNERIEGPIPPFPAAGVINNPSSAPARIIAYTTNTATTASAPADLNLVFCA